MKLSPLSAALLLSAISSPVSAEKYWLVVATSETGSRFAVDLGSVKERDAVQTFRPFPVRTIWVRGDHSADRTRKARTSMTLYGFHCAESTMATLSQAEYSANGRVLWSTANTTESQYDYAPVMPDTIGESVMEKACD